MSGEGIDVSNNNKGKLPPFEFEFMFVKASQGVSFNDTFFEGYVSEAKQRSIPWGPYHFAEPVGNTPEDEAAWFLRHAQRGPLGWALDVENYTPKHSPEVNPLAEMGASRLAAWLVRFRELVEPTLGPSWFYCNRSYADSLYPRLAPDWRTWLATLDGQARVETHAGRTIDIEQFKVEPFDFVNGVAQSHVDRNLARTPLIIDAGEDDDMVPPAIIQLVDTNGDLVVVPGGGGRPWTAKASDASLIAVFVFRVFDPDPNRRYPFPKRIPLVSDADQVASIRAWASSSAP